jgi:hypothetical protein
LTGAFSEESEDLRPLVFIHPGLAAERKANMATSCAPGRGRRVMAAASPKSRVALTDAVEIEPICGLPATRL